MLTTHVVSQGLAEELKRNGWPQEGSEFYWEMCDLYLENGAYVGEGKGFKDWNVVHSSIDGIENGDKDHIAAPLASELMERSNLLTVRRNGSAVGGWTACTPPYMSEAENVLVFDDPKGLSFQAETAPDALAALALHLMKEGKMKF